MGRGACAEIEPLLMMRPPFGLCAFMMRIASCEHQNIAFRLMSTTERHCSTVRSSIGTAGSPMPALLKSTSSRPHLAFSSAKMRFTSSGLVMSAASTRQRSFAPESAAVFSSSSLRRPTRPTQKPSLCSASAADLPMPVPAPVMSATFCMGLLLGLFGLRARDSHRAGAARAVLLDVGGELGGRAADHLVTLLDQLLLSEFRIFEDLLRAGIQPRYGSRRRPGRKEKPEPGVRLDFGIAELGEGRHLRQERRALRAADR